MAMPPCHSVVDRFLGKCNDYLVLPMTVSRTNTPAVTRGTSSWNTGSASEIASRLASGMSKGLYPVFRQLPGPVQRGAHPKPSPRHSGPTVSPQPQVRWPRARAQRHAASSPNQAARLAGDRPSLTESVGWPWRDPLPSPRVPQVPSSGEAVDARSVSAGRAVANPHRL